MPIRCWVSGCFGALLLGMVSAGCPAQSSIDLGAGKSITASVARNRTILHIRSKHSGAASVALERDASVTKGASAKLKLIATVGDSAVLLTDGYPSLSGGLSFCQAGREEFVRVLTFTHRRLIESYHAKIASCRDNIELADPGLVWSGETRTLTIHWLQGPGKQMGEPDIVIVTISSKGLVSVSNSQ